MQSIEEFNAETTRANLRYLATIAALILTVFAVVGGVHLVQQHHRASTDAKFQQDLRHAMQCDAMGWSEFMCEMTK